MASAVTTLKERGLSYHILIGRDSRASVVQLVNPEFQADHARGANIGTIGISFVGGGEFGEITAAQVSSAERVVLSLKKQFPNLKFIRGHKNVYVGGKLCGKQDPHIDVTAFARDVGLQVPQPEVAMTLHQIPDVEELSAYGGKW